MQQQGQAGNNSPAKLQLFDDADALHVIFPQGRFIELERRLIAMHLDLDTRTGFADSQPLQLSPAGSPAGSAAG